MAEKKVKLMKVEFIVEGGEDYYACLEFKRVRSPVVDIVSKIYTDYAEKAAAIIASATGDPKVKYVRLDLHITGKKVMKRKWLNVPLTAVIALEYKLVEAQKLMLDETSKIE